MKFTQGKTNSDFILYLLASKYDLIFGNTLLWLSSVAAESVKPTQLAFQSPRIKSTSALSSEASRLSRLREEMHVLIPTLPCQKYSLTHKKHSLTPSLWQKIKIKK